MSRNISPASQHKKDGGQSQGKLIALAVAQNAVECTATRIMAGLPSSTQDSSGMLFKDLARHPDLEDIGGRAGGTFAQCAIFTYVAFPRGSDKHLRLLKLDVEAKTAEHVRLHYTLRQEVRVVFISLYEVRPRV